MRYNYDLGDRYGQMNRKTYMLSTSEDLAKLRIKLLFTLIQSSVNITDEGIEEKLHDLCDKWLADKSMVSAFCDKKYDRENIRKEIEAFLPDDYEFNISSVDKNETTLAKGKMLQKTEQKDKGWDGIFEQLGEYDPLSKYCADGEVIICSRSDFDKRAKYFMQSTFA